MKNGSSKHDAQLVSSTSNKPPSQKPSEPAQALASNPKKNYSSLKIHRGPINMNAITMKEPETVIQDLMQILDTISVRFKQSNNFSLKCEIKDLRFLIEINLVEKFSNIFVIKFYKNNQSPKYFDLCAEIFSKLSL